MLNTETVMLKLLVILKIHFSWYQPGIMKAFSFHAKTELFSLIIFAVSDLVVYMVKYKVIIILVDIWKV